MMNFDTYLFRPHSVGNIMGGVAKPLTEEQQKTYNSLVAKHKSNNKNLSYAQMREYTKLMHKHKNPEKTLTPIQQAKLSELILKHEETGKNLTLNQIDTLGDLHRKKNAKNKLDDKAKKFLERIFWQHLTGRSNDITSKSLDKGIRCEEKSFTLYSNVTGQLLFNNKERRSNEFLTGECDNAQKKVIREVKTSWEYLTFPLTTDRITSSLYPWQIDSYMDLWGCKKAELIYCLVDTPFDLIEDQLRSLDRDLNILDMEGNVREEKIDLVVETVTRHIYTNEGLKDFCNQSTVVNIEWFENFKELPEEIRVKVFHQEYNEERIQQLKEMIVLAREYLNNLLVDLGDSAHKLTQQKCQEKLSA